MRSAVTLLAALVAMAAPSTANTARRDVGDTSGPAQDFLLRVKAPAGEGGLSSVRYLRSVFYGSGRGRATPRKFRRRNPKHAHMRARRARARRAR